jgi:excisionase family DNA binding protein
MATKVVEKAAWRISEFMAAYSIGRTKLYGLINDGHLRVLKSGRVTLIPRSSVDEWLKRCEVEADQRFQVLRDE